MDELKETVVILAWRQGALEADASLDRPGGGGGIPAGGHQVSTGTEAGECHVEVEGKTRVAWLGEQR